MTEQATIDSYQRLIAARPALNCIAPLRSYRQLPDRTLLHAGPPFRAGASIPRPLRNAICAAIMIEDWAPSIEAAAKLFDSGVVALSPAQDYGVVTPLAFVVGPSTVCLEVIDLNAPNSNKLAPLNDGPAPGAVRFGVCGTDAIATVRGLVDRVGADLAAALDGSVPLLPLMHEAVASGDDLHGHVAAFQERVVAVFGHSLTHETQAYLDSVGQFALNISMAASSLMIEAGAGVAGSSMVTACGGNGVEIGYKLADVPMVWRTVPATRPIGPHLPGQEGRTPLPAIGDSAVIEALGLGAACLRFCPTLADALAADIARGEIPSQHLTEAAHEAFLGAHPALPVDELRVGLDLARPRSCLGIMLGMVDAAGEAGLIGRGIAPWPSDNLDLV